MGDYRKMQPRPFKRNFFRFFREKESDAASRRLYLVSFGGMGKSIRNDGAPIRLTDALLVVRMSFQLVIPWRLALQLCRLRFTSPSDHASPRARLRGLPLREENEQIALKIKTVYKLRNT